MNWKFGIQIKAKSQMSTDIVYTHIWGVWYKRTHGRARQEGSDRDIHDDTDFTNHMRKVNGRK